MTETPELSSELFSIPLADGRFVVYAPLRRAAFVTNAALLRGGRWKSLVPVVTPEDCERYLGHADAVVRIMAAQTLALAHRDSAEARARRPLVEELFQLAHSRYWRRRR